MSNLVYPVLQGLGWDIKKTPEFHTILQRSASLKELRVSLTAYPTWHFEINYDYLSSSDLHTLANFFMLHAGSWDSWLFDDVTDDTTNGDMLFATGDGTTTAFQITRTLVSGGFAEQIQNLKDASAVVLKMTVVQEAYTVPTNNTSPYYSTVTVNNSPTTMTNDLGVKYSNGTALTVVQSNPTKGQYSVNVSTGVYTFFGEASPTGDGGTAVYISYKNQQPSSAYTISGLGVVTFTSAPPSAATITWNGTWYYRCRFTNDTMEFNEFMQNLWENQKVEFVSVKL